MIGRGLWSLVPVVLAAAGVAGASIVSFEELSLDGESWWNGSDGSGGFRSGPARFWNEYDATYGSWGGFSYSNMTDSVSDGWGAQYNAITGGGHGGSANYAVYYRGYGVVPSVTLDEAAVVEGFYVTNNNYAYYSMLRGDDYAKKFGGESGADADWFVLTVTGMDSAGEATGTVDFYLADFTSADDGEDYIVDGWRWVDLASLGVVKSLEFEVGSSDVSGGWMNTPGYFVMDDLSVVPEPGTAVLLGLGWLAMRRLKLGTGKSQDGKRFFGRGANGV